MVVVALVLAFAAIAGVALLTVRRIWTATDEVGTTAKEGAAPAATAITSSET